MSSIKTRGIIVFQFDNPFFYEILGISLASFFVFPYICTRETDIYLNRINKTQYV